MIADLVAQELHARELVDYRPDAAGGDCFLDDLPSVPAAAVGVYGRGGLPADAGLGYDEPSVQVVVRGASADPRPPHARARAIYDALHGLHHHALPGGTFLVSCAADQSDPVRIGPDTDGRHQYGLNFTLDVRAATQHRE
jgi:hypothetical protein